MDSSVILKPAPPPCESRSRDHFEGRHSKSRPTRHPSAHRPRSSRRSGPPSPPPPFRRTRSTTPPCTSTGARSRPPPPHRGIEDVLVVRTIHLHRPVGCYELDLVGRHRGDLASAEVEVEGDRSGAVGGEGGVDEGGV
ncbi:uncharacterized protein A4U43_C10F5510 [Asparagus officinalis]|uniref:Uncharacterized protein n=1 Tax=Asparagus officinalis TaxID=4686 RepID=A0A5P1E469_ASPOF|nr:uncharacterized protein A4U43_C10F5510 [Asparagus officinalis]